MELAQVVQSDSVDRFDRSIRVPSVGGTIKTSPHFIHGFLSQIVRGGGNLLKANHTTVFELVSREGWTTEHVCGNSQRGNQLASDHRTAVVGLVVTSRGGRIHPQHL